MAYKDPDKQKAFQRTWSKERARRAQEARTELKKDGCRRCGEMDEVALAFHHLKPEEKSFVIGSAGGGVRQTPAAIIEEAKKCIVLCHNCHAKLHAGRWALEEIIGLSSAR